MELLAEEIGLVGQQYFSSFNLAKIKALCSDLLRRRHYWIDERTHVVTEILSSRDDLIESVFFFGLKRQGWDLSLPLLQLLEFGTGRITWNLDAMVTDRACILVVFLDLAACDLQALSVIPMTNLVYPQEK